MNKFLYEGQEFEYKLIRSRRKSIGIKISFEEGIVISVPIKCSKSYVEEMLKEKAEWIKEKLKLVNDRAKDMSEREFITGEVLAVLGQNVPLEVNYDDIIGCKVRFNGEKFTVGISRRLDDEKRKAYIKETLNKIYRDMARKYYTERSAYYANILKVYPERITIKEQKSVWGSCSSKNNINYNWKVVMAPIEILDYIVVHELCHLKHRNHSKEYWKLVESILPDYERRDNWLKENGKYLGLDYVPKVELGGIY